MRIEYRILWFEDTKTWYDSIEEDLREYLNDNGFILKVELQENGSNIDSLPLSDFDLILMDLQLTSGDSGDKLIEKIRNYDIFTELVFYSQKGEVAVRNLIKQKGIDGVYCAGRSSDEFLEKVKKIINTTIKKVQDLNNMRGLMMAETSNLDELMLEITRNYLSKIASSESDDFKEKKLKKKTIETIKDRLKTFEKIDAVNDIETLLKNSYFEAQLKWRTVLNIAEAMKATDSISDAILETVRTYQTEVVSPRNKLAHVKEIEDESGKKVLSSSDFLFDDKMCISLRKNLQKHERNFRDLLEVINKL